MLKIRDIVSQLNDEEYQELVKRLKTSKAEKFLFLLTHLRQDVLPDGKISESLGISRGAYYTLKSRLHDKIQEFQMANTLGEKEGILKRVDSIPQLLYNTPRATAIAVLKKLESDLLKYDMPWELTRVYSALKKLHINTQEYYTYSQNYNKQVAYTVAIEKIEDLLADFNKYLGTFMLTRAKEELEYLSVIKEQVTAHQQLYNSHNMQLYKAMVDISFALFVPLEAPISGDSPIEDQLDEMKKILTNYEMNSSYRFIYKAYLVMSFEYYNQYKLHKKAQYYLDELGDNINSFLQCNFCLLGGRFLMSKMEHYVELGKKEKLFDENVNIQETYQVNVDDFPNYFLSIKYQAISALFAQKYFDIISLLNELVNQNRLKQYFHAEVEMKLFLAYCYFKVENFETALTLLRNIVRKMKDKKEPVYENALLFAKYIRALIENKDDAENDLANFLFEFNRLNDGQERMLEYIFIQATPEEAFAPVGARIRKSVVFR